jgi:toxin ParE1/3/4
VQLEWRKSAETDLLAIITEIANDKPLAARKFLTKLVARVNALTAFPEIGKASNRKGARGLHEIAIHPNYLIFYRFNEKRVEIVAVVHARRKWP